MRRKTLRNRKTAPKVTGGQVQYKNRWQQSPRLYERSSSRVGVVRHRPGRGYRHLVRGEDLLDFAQRLPDWAQLSAGLETLVLDQGECNTMGWHHRGIVAINAWERGFVFAGCLGSFVDEHWKTLDRLGVPYRRAGAHWRVEFNEETARAFLLVHVFVHELGHQVDCMSTRSRRDAPRGESFADAYAFRHEEEVLHVYESCFGVL